MYAVPQTYKRSLSSVEKNVLSHNAQLKVRVHSGALTKDAPILSLHVFKHAVTLSSITERRDPDNENTAIPLMEYFS